VGSCAQEKLEKLSIYYYEKCLEFNIVTKLYIALPKKIFTRY
jgi:hypothetical protein